MAGRSECTNLVWAAEGKFNKHEEVPRLNPGWGHAQTLHSWIQLCTPVTLYILSNVISSNNFASNVIIGPLSTAVRPFMGLRPVRINMSSVGKGLTSSLHGKGYQVQQGWDSWGLTWVLQVRVNKFSTWEISTRVIRFSRDETVEDKHGKGQHRFST